MDAIFMNAKNSKMSDLHRLILNLSDKKNLMRSDKYAASMKKSCENLKAMKKNLETMYLKYQLLRGMINLNYLIDHILYKIFNITEYITKKH